MKVGKLAIIFAYILVKKGIFSGLEKTTT